MNTRKDLAAELANTTGPKYWRSLEEMAESSAFRELMEREFPEQATEWEQPPSRRRFLALMGASLALAGLNGCSVKPAPARHMVPYVRSPEEIVPGRPLFFATSMTLGGSGVGLLVESHLGRPTKIEGNPDHPASLGATDVFQQASVLTLYDPDRSQAVTELGQTRTWESAAAVLRTARENLRAVHGRGLRVLSESLVSPTLADQRERVLAEFPEAKWHQYEPIARDTAHRAGVRAFGSPVNTYYDFTKADVVLALDSDFLGYGPASLRYTHDFMERRRVRDASSANMNRLYVVETAVTTTGGRADHRLALKASAIHGFTQALAGRLGVEGFEVTHPQQAWVDAAARDLQQHRGRSIVVAGDRQPAAVHVLAHVLNQRLGNIGTTVFHTVPLAAHATDQLASLRELAEDMNAGRVDTLLILGGNPVYTAPVDLDFVSKLQKVRLRVHLSLYQDETSRQCHWHLPETHYLETWSDTRAFDGTASLAQPLIEPLYQGRSAHELVQLLTTGREESSHAIVQSYWRRYSRQQNFGGDFETFWQRSVHDGVVANTRFPVREVTLRPDWQQGLEPASSSATMELVFQGDPTIYDGRFANNGWLQELPKPITKLTWDNAALMSPRTAQNLGVGFGSYAPGGEHGGYHQEVLELRVGERTLRAPVWIMPGHADDAVTLHLGYGREHAGRVGGTSAHPVGVNGYKLSTLGERWIATGLSLARTGQTYPLACTQQHHLMENRALVRSATLPQFQQEPTFATALDREHERELTQRGARRPLTMYRETPQAEHQWAMTIDLTACTGCQSCVVACQSENNIPVVGKDQVLRGREMHWLRVDRYISGPFERPEAFHFQPVPCMHCENAPCEYVCPVEATVHSADGLNDMVYQRCVGTRFCSNNCPYKVRRFNFLAYADFHSEGIRQQYNPDVTVRSRGVMEKCTYCVQRIRRADIDARVEGRPLRDGDVLTACQAACPASAITFGDLNDAQSRVRAAKDSPLNYALLADLNTLPRTTYLAELRNPNPELEGR